MSDVANQDGAITIKLEKAKGHSTKGIVKLLLMVSVLFSSLEKVGHEYFYEQKRITIMNSLPDHSNLDQMCFSGMHTITTYAKVVSQVEHNVEHLMETAGAKFQSTAMITEAKRRLLELNVDHVACTREMFWEF